MVAFAGAFALLSLYQTVVSGDPAKREAGDAGRGLEPWTFPPFALGVVRAEGWLLDELQTMADGLAGHEHEFYLYVANSTWILGPDHGHEYSSLNEGFPYWFNGVVPLAYLTNNAKLKSFLLESLDKVLYIAKGTDGWIGPEEAGNRAFWGRMPFLLGMTQLAEAEGDTTEYEIVEALSRFMWVMNDMLHNGGEGLATCPPDVECSWGQARVADLILTVQWLLENNANDQNTTRLWENMDLLYNYTSIKWETWYRDELYQEVVTDPTRDNPNYPFLHGVNVGQGLKSPAVVRRFTGNQDLVGVAYNAVNRTLTFHGSATGAILGDEILRDAAPYSGSELCTIVETTYSLAYLYHALGDVMYADYAELAIYNSFPTMMTPHYWAHQYISQPNQPWVRFEKAEQSDPHVFTTTNEGAATTFGLEPQYPCCTVNHPQGLPKFVSNSWGTVWAETNKTQLGIAHLLLGPSSVTFQGFTVNCSTKYPFELQLNYTITFPTYNTGVTELWLSVRMPGWHQSNTSSIEASPSLNQNYSIAPNETTGLTRVKIPFTPGMAPVTVNFTIGTAVRLVDMPNDTVSVFYGPLLYSLDLGQKNTSTDPHAWMWPDSNEMTGLPFPQARDYYLESINPWAVAIDPEAGMDWAGNDVGKPLQRPAWDYQQEDDGPVITVTGCEIAWDLYLNRTPGLPPALNNRTCIGGSKQYRMVPYGRAKLHMSELPVVNLTAQGFNVSK
ncbi:hypothetical protein QBC37DRAFT_475435 [Rhypophila decipiens]|uniref:Non-reducing end beta-L-arabinofuranosidase-like GH127 catalytic domain-containing protein n=1 Tax=Rhypophila decipiens TaxID=261697 RepID=A0AAN6XZ44_9PEZI|nr:hypothetical protein QBC37DRAFT_475435 [Rhypophila decipiens]